MLRNCLLTFIIVRRYCVRLSIIFQVLPCCMLFEVFVMVKFCIVVTCRCAPPPYFIIGAYVIYPINRCSVGPKWQKTWKHVCGKKKHVCKYKSNNICKV
jgi:hypothetical protein